MVQRLPETFPVMSSDLTIFREAAKLLRDLHTKSINFHEKSTMISRPGLRSGLDGSIFILPLYELRETYIVESDMETLHNINVNSSADDVSRTLSEKANPAKDILMRSSK